MLWNNLATEKNQPKNSKKKEKNSYLNNMNEMISEHKLKSENIERISTTVVEKHE